jgi:YVTN family beta-propeller protein
LDWEEQAVMAFSAKGVRRAVLGVSAIVLLACLAVGLAGCWGTGGSAGKGSVDQSITVSPAADEDGTSMNATEKAAWRQTLLDRLAEEPGSVYNAVGYEPNALDRIDCETNKKAVAFNVGHPLKWLAMKPDGSEVWATPENWDIQTGVRNEPIAVIDTASGKVKSELAVRHPNKLAFSPDGTKVYVTLVLDDAIAVYDSATKKELERIEVGKHPLAISVSFDGKTAYVVHGTAVVGKKKQVNTAGIKIAAPDLEAGSEYLAVIDLDEGKVTHRVELGGFGAGVAVSPDGSLVLATVSSVDVATVGGGSASSSGSKRWDGVAAISTESMKVVKRMKFADRSGPTGVAFTPDGKKAYAICGASDSATPIDVAALRLGKGIVLGLGG